MKLWYFPGLIIISLLYFWIPSSMCCNKALCASDVSKCLIQELCQCRPGEGNCSCCKECMLCLGTLWDECCDCVGMCNPRNFSDTPPTSKSTVEELHEPIPSLFRALTEGDTQLSWKIVSFPVAEELSHHENLVSILETVNHPQHQNVSISNNNVRTSYSSEKERVCTVVYFDDCMSIHQCKISCGSTGASKYRWFHNACCECIGPECVDYGSKTIVLKLQPFIQRPFKVMTVLKEGTYDRSSKFWTLQHLCRTKCRCLATSSHLRPVAASHGHMIHYLKPSLLASHNQSQWGSQQGGHKSFGLASWRKL